MITNVLQTAGTVLQTSGGISIDLLLLVGIAAAIVIVLAWMFTQGGSSSD